MNKLEALKLLLERVKDKQKLVQYHYTYELLDGTKCHCAVGHLMDICGIDMDPKKSFVIEHDEGITDVLANFPKFIEPITDLGFTEEELFKLQDINDDGEYDELMNYIKELIKENGGVVHE